MPGDLNPVIAQQLKVLTGWEGDYTLGWLLDKLMQMSTMYNIRLYYSQVNRSWRCKYDHYDNGSVGDTAADAAARLIIKLVKHRKEQHDKAVY